MTSTVPPCANAHGSAKPPAPKMALMTLMMAAVSPVSPPDAAAGVAEDAAEVARRSPRFMDAGWSVVAVIDCLWADGAIEVIRWSLPPTTGCLTGVGAVRLARRGVEAIAGRDSASVARVIAIAGIVRRVGDAHTSEMEPSWRGVECERVRLRVPLPKRVPVSLANGNRDLEIQRSSVPWTSLRQNILAFSSLHRRLLLASHDAALGAACIRPHHTPPHGPGSR